MLVYPRLPAGVKGRSCGPKSIGFSRLGLCKCEGAATGGQSAFSQTIHLRQGYGGQAAKKGMVPGVARASRMALKPRRMAGCPWRAASPAYCGEYRCRMEGPGFSPARVGRGPAPRPAPKPMLLECDQEPASPRLRRPRLRPTGFPLCLAGPKPRPPYGVPIASRVSRAGLPPSPRLRRPGKPGPSNGSRPA